MNASSYSATPAMQAYSPAKTFPTAAAALDYAEHAARTFRVAYVVWERSPRLQKLKTFNPPVRLEVSRS